MNVVTFPDTVIKEYQDAFCAYFGGKAPKITRRTNRGYIIHGSKGDSAPLTSAHMKRLTRAMRAWCRDRNRRAEA